jgi:hypothetical protein
MPLAVHAAMRTSTLLAFFFSASTFALSSGCVVESAGPPRPEPQPQPQSQVTLATVDTGVTLSSPPGQGAGVNVEYQAGGHWHIWWTCDTQISGLHCTFYVDVTTQSGSITNVAGDRLESDDVLSTPAANEVTLTTDTSTGVDGVFFDTTPGATINVLQQIGNVQDGTYFYWGQNGQVLGGGDPANVADPLSFTGSSP